jgi:hypothetical protein
MELEWSRTLACKWRPPIPGRSPGTSPRQLSEGEHLCQSPIVGHGALRCIAGLYCRIAQRQSARLPPDRVGVAARHSREEKRISGLFSVLKSNSRDPAVVSRWVRENAPCFKGPVSQDWTQAVYYEASVRRIPPWVLTFGLSLTRKYGYRFSDSAGGTPLLTVTDLNPPTPGRS